MRRPAPRQRPWRGGPRRKSASRVRSRASAWPGTNGASQRIAKGVSAQPGQHSAPHPGRNGHPGQHLKESKFPAEHGLSALPERQAGRDERRRDARIEQEEQPEERHQREVDQSRARQVECNGEDGPGCVQQQAAAGQRGTEGFGHPCGRPRNGAAARPSRRARRKASAVQAAVPVTARASSSQPAAGTREAVVL